jgi:hypothetical protein
MYRFNCYGCRVAQFSDMQYTDSELDDWSCRILQSPKSDVRDCKLSLRKDAWYNSSES